MATGRKNSPQVASHPRLEVPTPAVRSLQVYAIDPSSGKNSGNQVTVQVPWERTCTRTNRTQDRSHRL